MTDLDLTANKETVLKQIDVLHEEHRLKVLKELAEQYNANSTIDNAIDLKRYTTAKDLIISLWMRGVEIPPGLAFDDRYDATFVTYVRECERYAGNIKYSERNVRKHELALLLDYPKELAFFIYDALNYPGIKRRYGLYDHLTERSGEHADNFTKVWMQLRPNPGDDLAECLYWCLSEYDLAFLAISLSVRGMYSQGKYLSDFFEYTEKIRL